MENECSFSGFFHNFELQLMYLLNNSLQLCSRKFLSINRSLQMKTFPFESISIYSSEKFRRTRLSKNLICKHNFLRVNIFEAGVKIKADKTKMKIEKFSFLSLCPPVTDFVAAVDVSRKFSAEKGSVSVTEVYFTLFRFLFLFLSIFCLLFNFIVIMFVHPPRFEATNKQANTSHWISQIFHQEAPR